MQIELKQEGCKMCMHTFRPTENSSKAPSPDLQGVTNSSSAHGSQFQGTKSGSECIALDLSAPCLAAAMATRVSRRTYPGRR